MKREFSTLDVVKALDIPRERLREWMNKGYIEPSIQQAKGQGTKALFSRRDVYGIALFRRLLESGFTRDKAAAFIREAVLNPNRSSVIKQIIFGKKGDQIKALMIHDIDKVMLDLSSGKVTLPPPIPGEGPIKDLVTRLSVDLFSQGDWDEIHIFRFDRIQMEIEGALEVL